MPHLLMIEPNAAEGELAELYEAATKKMGKVPNMVKSMAHSPAAVKAYLSMSGALGKGVLSMKYRERIALAVSEFTRCHYCVSAHTAIAKMAGLNDEQIALSRVFEAEDEKASGMLEVVEALLQNHGHASGDEFNKLRGAGFTDAEIVEVVACVALNLYTTFFNGLNDTAIDFPEVELLSRV